MKEYILIFSQLEGKIERDSLDQNGTIQFLEPKHNISL